MILIKVKVMTINSSVVDFNNFMMFFFEGIKSSLIYPCTDMHIEKYRKQNRCLIQESADDYYNITLPYIQSNQLSVEVSS